MKIIADLLKRIWHRDRPVSSSEIPVANEKRDRSSMADFVRILQAHDTDQARSS